MLKNSQCNMYKLPGFDGCQWLRCRQTLDRYRRDCANQGKYFEAALADARTKELIRLEGQWQREVVLKRFLAERRKLGHEFQNEFKELLLSLDQSFKTFKAEKQKRRANVGQNKVKDHSWPVDREVSEEAEEEEEQEDDEIFEDSASGSHAKVMARCTWSEEIQDSKVISDPTTVMSTFPLVTSGDPVEKEELASPETHLPCRVHSVKAIELRHKARKLALVQRYAAAAKLQAKAKLIEEKWHQSHVAKVKEQEKDTSQEMLAREKIRLEKRLEEEQQALSNDALRAQQQLLQQHSCRKDRLVRRQLKIWKSVGGSQSLEEALREAAGRGDSSVASSEAASWNVGRVSRPASAPARRR
eukprot:s3745_g2.t1